MDTFHEQIVAIKKTAGKYAAIICIWLAAVAVSVVAFLFTGSFGLIIACGAGYGAYYLSRRFFIEYEYIVTNGIMDIDRIIAKSSRKRDLSFSLENVSGVEKYNPNARNASYNKTVIAANPTNEAYAVTIFEEGKGKTLLVIAPNDDIKESMKKFMPKFVSNSAFK